MKFTVVVKNLGDVDAVSGGRSWKETYDRHEIDTLDKAKLWATSTIKEFNATLRDGERRREVIEVYEERIRRADVAARHQWRKDNLVTLRDHSGLFDKLTCGYCSATARRYGMDTIIMDAKYRAKKWRYCPGKQ